MIEQHVSRMGSSSPPDVEDSVEHLAELHRQHEQSTSRIQRGANRATSFLGRPGTLGVITLMIIVWMSGNYVARRLGMTAFEEFPFPDLAFIATIAAVLVALLILTTQRHQDQLAERRAQLTLQISILSEKKIAKIIALLEEQRHENPMLASRVDEEAAAMAQPVDPRETLNTMEQAL